MLLAWDTPTSSLSAGWTRYVLERRFGQPVTTVRTASLGRANFADYDVVVLPSGNYAGQIDDAVLNRLKDWLRAGGTLVTLAEATRWATGSSVGLLDTNALLKDGRPDTPATTGAASGQRSRAAGRAARLRQRRRRRRAPPSPMRRRDGSPVRQGDDPQSRPAVRNPSPERRRSDYDKAIQPDRERPDAQPGAILRVTLDTDHWLSAGQRRRDAGDDRGRAGLRADQAQQRPQRRHLRAEGRRWSRRA